MNLDATELLNTLLGLGGVGIGFSIFLIIIFKLKDITLFHEYLSTKKRKSITEALDSGLITGKSAEYLKESLENKLFKSFEKVSWEKPFREKLLELRDNSNGNLSFNKIKRAETFIKYKDNRLVVEISCFEKIFLRLILLEGIVLLIISAALCILFVLNLHHGFNNPINISQSVIIKIVIIFSIFMNTYMAIIVLKIAQSLKYALEIDAILSKDSLYQTRVEKCNLSSLKRKFYKISSFYLSVIKDFFK